MQEIEATISGRVQMVMYRDFAQRKARKLGIKGTVKNQEDGTVRVIAQGDQPTLKTYIDEHLRQGPLLANVRDVEVIWRGPTETFSDFSIVY